MVCTEISTGTIMIMAFEKFLGIINIVLLTEEQDANPRI
jgi:hypothetical protein